MICRCTWCGEWRNGRDYGRCACDHYACVACSPGRVACPDCIARADRITTCDACGECLAWRELAGKVYCRCGREMRVTYRTLESAALAAKLAAIARTPTVWPASVKQCPVRA